MNRYDGDLPRLSSASSDGQWILWNSPICAGAYTYAARLDGSGRCRFPSIRGMDSGAFWLASSHQIIKIEAGDMDGSGLHTCIMDAEHPEIVRRSRLAIASDLLINSDHAFLAEDHLFIADYPEEKKVKLVTAVECRFQGTSTRIARHPVLFPYPVRIESAVFSPRGNLIAWLTVATITTPITKLMHRFWPVIQEREQNLRGIWVSDADGSNLREIGHLTLLPPDTPIRYNNVDALKWLPDSDGSETLGFVCNDRFYVVPAR